MPVITIYSKPLCIYCIRAKLLLKMRGYRYRDVPVTEENREWLIEKTQRRTVPQIFIGETHVGGFDDLSALDARGELAPLVERAESAV